jgi:hypothetical protein
MIYLKSALVGLLAVLAAAILTVIFVLVYGSIAFRSAERSSEGSIGWDPISLAKPLTWLGVLLGIFWSVSFGSFSEFVQSSRNPSTHCFSDAEISRMSYSF